MKLRVYSYDVETKVQSSQWTGKLSTRSKKCTPESLKCEGDVDSFFLKGIVYYEFVPRGETVKSST